MLLTGQIKLNGNRRNQMSFIGAVARAAAKAGKKKKKVKKSTKVKKS